MAKAKVDSAKIRKIVKKDAKVKDAIDTKYRLSDVMDASDVLPDGLAERIELDEAINSSANLRDLIQDSLGIADVMPRQGEVPLKFTIDMRLSSIVDEDVTLADVIARDATLRGVLSSDMLNSTVLPDGRAVEDVYPGAHCIADLIPKDARLADTMRKTHLRDVIDDQRDLKGALTGDARLGGVMFGGGDALRVTINLAKLRAAFNRELRLRDIVPASVKLRHVIDAAAPKFQELSPSSDVGVIPSFICFRDVIPSDIRVVDLIPTDPGATIELVVRDTGASQEELLRSLRLSQVVGRSTQVRELFPEAETLLAIASDLADVNDGAASKIRVRDVIKTMFVCELLSSFVKLGDVIGADADVIGLLEAPMSPRPLSPFSGRLSPLDGRGRTVSEV